MDNTSKGLLKKLRLPEVRQVGIVVKDLDDAVAYYSKLGIRPWFQASFSDEEHIYRGKKAEYDVDIALAFSGQMQFELICPKEGDENTHMNHLKNKGEGIHHVGFFVSDIDRRLEGLRELGVGVIPSGYLKSTGKAGGSHTAYAYLDTTSIGGVILELIQTKFIGVTIQMSRFWFELGALTGDVKKMA
jgi:methylmalonyl-CoA/ethylmalonyl-CoA epimerase